MANVIIFIVGLLLGTALGVILHSIKIKNSIRGNVATYYIHEDDETYMMLEIFPGKKDLLNKDDTLFKIKRYSQ